MNQLVYESEGSTVAVALDDKPVSLGRGDDADHKLPTKLASRVHAHVFPREGAWWLEDLGSSNGTGLNNKKLTEPTPLYPDDVIMIGDLRLTFEGEPPKPDAPPDHLIARIVYSPGADASPVDTLIRDRITIGRKPNNDLQIEDKAISSQHCEIVNRDGLYILRDLDSSNGTFINSKRVTEQTLRNGDKIVLGAKVDVYFVDPAGKPPDAVDQTPDSDGAPAEDAFERGTFEPVEPGPETKKKESNPNPLPPIAVGLGLGVLFVITGWLLGGVIVDLTQPVSSESEEHVPEAVLDDTAFSFEGRIDKNGNPEGWSANYESSNGTAVELFADPEDPFDGKSSLCVVNVSPRSGTLLLQTTDPRKIDFGGAFNVGLHLRGEGVSRVALALSVLNESGRVQTLAAGSFVGIKNSSWVQVNMIGTPVTDLPENANLRLMISSRFTRLWIDRLEIIKTKDEPTASPYKDMGAGGLELGIDATQVQKVGVDSVAGNLVQLQPRVLAHDDAVVSEPELWAVANVKEDAVDYAALLSTQGNAAAVTLRARAYNNGYFIDRGLELEWSLTPGAGETLAVDVIFPFTRHSELSLADRRGFPLKVDHESVHAYAYSTLSELFVNEGSPSVSFPQGAVVWLDFSRNDQLVATVRAPVDSARRRMTVRVNSRPLMYVRLYQRLYDEGVRMMESAHFSAAIERFEHLANLNRPDGDVPAKALARQKLIEIEAHRGELEVDVNASWERVNATRNAVNLREAQGLVRRYLAEFAGDELAHKMARRRGLIEAWIIKLETSARTPEEMQAAEKIARQLFAAAKRSFDEGNFLLALVMLENIQRDYADTSQFLPAKSLTEQIDAKLNDPVERNRIIDEALAEIDEDIKFQDYTDAREQCLELFKRFPNTDRNRDIMKRLKAIESAFED